MKKILLYALSILMAFSIASCHNTKNLAKQHHKDLEDVYKSLKAEMPEAMVTMEGDRVKVVLPESVLFSKNSAELNKDYLPILAKMAGILNKYEKTSIMISGYTDITGTEAYNLDLSKKRAENAKQVFVNDKVKPSRMYTWGRGEKDPIADNGTEAGRMQNRRVEYVILYDYKPQE
jgi:outer membrane protein OmpA-like peptidoglycan-associated protein